MTVAIIVTHESDKKRFPIVLRNASLQTDRVIIVDNASSNSEELKTHCSSIKNCDFIEVGFNSGIGHALNIGVIHALRYNPDWILLLDDDTILLDGSIEKALRSLDSLLSRGMREKVMVVSLGSQIGDCSLKRALSGTFSGSLVRAEVFKKIKFRENFFLDQADFDFYSRVWEHGYIALLVDCKLIDHPIGKREWIPVLSKLRGEMLQYEPPWRYYYIVRNSTILLIERRLYIGFYLSQLVRWGLRILFKDGFFAFIKPLALGLFHGLLRMEGYMDKRVFS
jgi:rhamnosyltransferase